MRVLNVGYMSKFSISSVFFQPDCRARKYHCIAMQCSAVAVAVAVAVAMQCNAMQSKGHLTQGTTILNPPLNPFARALIKRRKRQEKRQKRQEKKAKKTRKSQKSALQSLTSAVLTFLMRNTNYACFKCRQYV